ncbi:MAG: FAD-dependent oxidoreductase, partial [Betaproteobacteria bacterium]
VLRDAMFGGSGGSNLLLPRIDLSSLFPTAAAHWLRERGAVVHIGSRVQHLTHEGDHWCIQGEKFDQVLLATAAPDALHLLQASAPQWPDPLQSPTQRWIAMARQMQHMPIATVYAWAANARLDQPMLTLRADPAAAAPMPAQFVFDRGRLGGPAGLLAFVISASHGTREALQAQVLHQAKAQLGLQLQAVQTVIEKRATIACTPALQRPPMEIAGGLLACADYVDGPYPSTLEGAVRSAIAAIR